VKNFTPEIFFQAFFVNYEGEEEKQQIYSPSSQLLVKNQTEVILLSVP